MAEVGIGQMAATTGRARQKIFKNNVLDNHPVTKGFKDNGGIYYEDGGRTVVSEFYFAQNPTSSWVGESGQVSLSDVPVMDAAEQNWAYMLGSYIISRAEELKNSGGSDTKILNLVSGKQKVLEDSMMNDFHDGVLGDGTGSSGLEITGLAAYISKTPTVGTIGGIDRSNSDAAFYRNYKFNTSSDWTLGAVDATNVKKFLDKLINNTIRGATRGSFGVMGNTHFEALSDATNAITRVTNEDNKVSGVDRDTLVYRGIKWYFGGGINFSGADQVQADLTYLINSERGHLNICYHSKGEFELLEPRPSRDQAVYSRLMFTMVAMIGGMLRGQAVGYDS